MLSAEHGSLARLTAVTIVSRVDRNPIRRVPLKDEGRAHPTERIPPGDAIAMMWQLTMQAWMVKEGMIDEPRLRRDVVRTVRGRR